MDKAYIKAKYAFGNLGQAKPVPAQLQFCAPRNGEPRRPQKEFVKRFAAGLP